MDTAELFAGTKSFSKVAASLGHSTLTFELEARFNPDHRVDILVMPTELVPMNLDMLWASPPCQGFSVAVIGRNWNRDHTPKTDSARLGEKLLKKTLQIIEARKPIWWFIENPRGKMRRMPYMIDPDIEQNLDNLHPIMRGAFRHTIAYCQYGDNRQKPTDIWTNAYWWKPRPMCVRSSPCHEAAPRGSSTGTQGLKGDEKRSEIPAELFREIFSQYPAMKVAA